MKSSGVTLILSQTDATRRWLCHKLTRSVTLFDAELLDAIAQRAKAHTEELRCRRLVVPCLFQSLNDGTALDAFELAAERGVRINGGGRCRGGTFCAGRAARHPQTDVLTSDDPASAERERPLEDVLQLAHVAREWVGLEHSKRLYRDLRCRTVGALREPLEDRFGDLANIAAALPQGRDAHLDHVDAIIEVLAKEPLRDQVGEIPVGG